MRTAVGLVLVLVLCTWATAGPGAPATMKPDPQRHETTYDTRALWSTGHANVSFDGGTVMLTQPQPTWNSSGTASMSRYGACAVGLPNGDVLIMGGRVDPDPQAQGDETDTADVLIWDEMNGSWTASDQMMAQTHVWCAATFGAGKVFVVGDWSPESGEEFSQGRLSILDLQNDSWSIGPPLPSGREAGAVGVAFHEGLLYVAGGATNPSGSMQQRTLTSFDPVTEAWTNRSAMNASRFDFPLVSFEDRLYAIGGASYNGTTFPNRTVVPSIEVYDPTNDTWTFLRNMSSPRMGARGAVVNGEILIIGGHAGTSASSTVTAFRPSDGSIANRPNLPHATYGHAAAASEHRIVCHGGATGFVPYSIWQTVTARATAWVPDTRTGRASTVVLDLGPSPESSARPWRISVDSEVPNGTEVTWSWRGGMTNAELLASAFRGPDGAGSKHTDPVLYPPTDHTGRMLQVAVDLRSGTLPDWSSPKVRGLEVLSEHVGFDSNQPGMIHPFSAPAVITTLHQSHAGNGTAELHLQMRHWSGTPLGAPIQMALAGDDLTLHSSGWPIHATTTVTNGSGGAFSVAWALEFGNLTGVSSMTMTAVTHGSQRLEHTSTEVVMVDRDYTAEIVHITTVDDATPLSTLTPIGSGVEHIALVNGSFSSDGMVATGGGLEHRLRIGRLGDDDGATWNNTSTDWIREHNGTALIPWTVPVGFDGRVELMLDSRSDSDLLVTPSTLRLNLRADGSAPEVVGLIPTSMAEVDRSNGTNVTIDINDAGGLDASSVRVQVWVQGLHDGLNGTLDGLPDAGEFVPIEHQLLQGEGMSWMVLTRVNHSMNPDGGAVRFQVIATDLVGRSLVEPSMTLGFTTRVGATATIEWTSSSMVFAPHRTERFDILVVDTNGWEDITVIQAHFGADSNLGFRYDVNNGTCSVLDDRWSPDGTVCSRLVNGTTLHLTIQSHPMWSMLPEALEIGRVDLEVTERDGGGSMTIAGAWVLDRGLVIDGIEVMDPHAPVTGAIRSGHIAQTETSWILEGWINRTDGSPYSGPVDVGWTSGTLGRPWSGEARVTVSAGRLNMSLTAPTLPGPQDLQVSIRDPVTDAVFAEHRLGTITMDDEAPLLLSSTRIDPVSRYDLGALAFGMNIEETTGWSGPLTLSCQVRSDGVTWPVVDTVIQPDSRNGNLVLFTARVNLTGAGNPRDLGDIAYLGCWATGSDDAGRTLTAQANNDPDFPWIDLTLTDRAPDLAWERTPVVSRTRTSASIAGTYENIGSPSDRSTTLEIQTPTGEVLIRRSIPPLGEGEQGTFEVQVDPSDIEMGFVALLDVGSIITERDETNNRITVDGAMTSMVSASIMAPASIIGVLLLISILGVIRWRRQGAGSVEGEASVPAEVEDWMPPSLATTAVENNNTPVVVQSRTIVDGWEDLPGGGRYDTSEGTTRYIVSETERWTMQSDGSFIREGV